MNTQNLSEDFLYVEILPGDNLNSMITMQIVINEVNTDSSDYEEFKKLFNDEFTEEAIVEIWKSTFGDNELKVSNFIQEDMKTDYNKVLRVQYNVSAAGAEITQTVYNFFVDRYIITFAANDLDQMELAEITDYMIKSIVIK